MSTNREGLLISKVFLKGFNCMFVSLSIDPPNVTALPVEIIINQTQEAVFMCTAYGIPTPSITWTKLSDGSAVTNTATLTITDSVIATNTLQSELRFIQGFKADESQYMCRGSNGVTNVIGSPEDDNVTLFVQGK